MSYEYDLAGNMLTQTYPSGRIVTQQFDLQGKLARVQSQPSGQTPRTYANGFSYAAHGEICRMRLGNGRWEQTKFNSRLQPQEIGIGTSAADSSLMKLTYDYGTSNNTGSVVSQSIIAPGLSLSQTFTYDELNRLKSARETGGSQLWQQTFIYDRYGNRNFDETQTTATVLTDNPSISITTNRLNAGGYEYDDAGNLAQKTTNGVITAYLYDGENRLVQVNAGGTDIDGSTYTYDGNGHRVKKVAGSVTSIFVYNIDSQIVAEYSTSAPPQIPKTSYLTEDALDTPRLITKADGTVQARHDYLPFGEEIMPELGGRTVGQGYIVDTVRQKFTGKERDVETGLDYFLARYYSPTFGRFISPDEFTGGPDEFYDFADLAADNPTFYADLTDPQSLNKYTYCHNNPLLYVDPDGHQGVREYARVALDNAADFAYGLTKGGANVLTGGVGFGPRPDDTLADRLGQIVGNNTVGGTGAIIALSGAAEIAGTDGAAALAVVPVAQVTVGSAMTVSAVRNLNALANTPIQARNNSETEPPKPKEGSRGGPGSHKGFATSTKNEARGASGNKCVFCGKTTTRSSGPRQSQIDHAYPKSRGGNNSLKNAQNTCRSCNQSKGTKTSAEFLRKRGK